MYKFRYDELAAGGEHVEDEFFKIGVVGLADVEVGESAEAAGEVCGGGEGAGEEVFLFDEVGVEEDGEGGGVEESDDPGIGGEEGSGRHVDFEDGGVVEADPGFEELVPALPVEEVEPVLEGAEDGEAVVARDFAEGELGVEGRWTLTGFLEEGGFGYE